MSVPFVIVVIGALGGPCMPWPLLVQTLHADPGASSEMSQPFDRSRPVHRAVVSPDGSGLEISPLSESASDLSSATADATAFGGETLIYSNTLGNRVLAPGPFVRISDDLMTVAGEGCLLDRYEVLVDGNADGTGFGPFAVEVSLYDRCPLDGGVRLPGTLRSVQLPDAGVYLIEVPISPDEQVVLPVTMWLGVRFNRNGAGWVMGAPPLVGYSGNLFELGYFGCSWWLGTYPEAPHASFYAQVFARGACPSEYTAYRSTDPPSLSVLIGAGVRVADDLVLEVDDCDMVGYEAVVRGTATFDCDLRLSNGSGTPGAIIEPSRRTIDHSGNRLRRIQTFFDPPIRVPRNLWFTLQSSSNYGEVAISESANPVGTTSANQVVRFVDGAWQTAPIVEGEEEAALMVTIRCAGRAPFGACCDSIFVDKRGYSVCRNVPRANCPFTQWLEGAACEPDPFDPRCGVAACCRSDGQCIERAAPDCGPGTTAWHRGLYCDDPGVACAEVCTFGTGSCDFAHPETGCSDAACCQEVCSRDAFCCDYEWDEACANDSHLWCASPPTNDECAPDRFTQGAHRIELGTTTNVSVRRASKDPNDPGFCCHTGFPGHCIGGCEDGALCEQDADCPGAAAGFCQGQGFCAGGCEDGHLCESNLDCVGSSDGVCPPRDPVAGTPGVGTVWLRFETPPPASPSDTSTVNVELSTCGSNAPAKDSLLEAFSVASMDQGRCDDFGRCADGSPCRVSFQDCADGRTCISSPQSCSVAGQDCPVGAPCVLDERAACDSLQFIGCNDDAGDACGVSDQSGNSELCLPDLPRGRPYYVLLAAKTADYIGDYALSARLVSQCRSSDATNDLCYRATPIGDGVHPFDLAVPENDCLTDPCVAGAGDDVWFDYIAPRDGVVEVQTCPASGEDAPDTSLTVYEGCECPLLSDAMAGVRCCSGDAGGACGPASRCTFEVVDGGCYKIRVGDEGGGRPAGSLTVHSRDGGLCPPGLVAWLDPPPGVIDAGFPHDPADATVHFGIDRLRVRSPEGSVASCWEICETGGNTNAVVRQEWESDGTATLVLDRPITTGATTVVRYRDDTGLVTEAELSALPGDVNGDGTTSPADILSLVDVLNGVFGPPWGALSADIDRSGAVGASDVLAIIDLLNGAGSFEVWNGRTLPSAPVECP